MMRTEIKARWLLLLLGVLMLALAVSACGSAVAADSQTAGAVQPAEIQSAAAATPEPETKTLYIGPALEDCSGVGQQTCMMVKESPDGDYHLFYQPIEGFDYEEGYEYEIVVNVEKVENPPADASSLKYILVKIVSKTSADAKETVTAQSAGLENVEWRLTSYLGADGMTDVVDEAPITLSFADGKAVGNAGCNRYFTSYEVKDDAMTFGEPIGRTMMACPDPVMEQEDAYLALLPKVATFKLDDHSLTLFDANGETLLAFELPATAAGPEKEATLIGPVWQWQRTEMSNDETITVDDPTLYTVQFKDDGSVVVKADCKMAQGDFTDDNGSLSIQLGPTTMNVCSDDSLADEFLKELSYAGTYVFDDDGNLVINMQMDGGNLYFAAAQEVTTASEGNAAMKPFVGEYKVILPPEEEGGALRVATLTLKEDGAFDLSILTLGEEKPETFDGVWSVVDSNRIKGLVTSEEGADEFFLTVEENGDLKLEGSELELINIDETIPLHKQLPIPVITEQKAYVTLDIQAGNPLDPFIVSVNGGGTFDASALGGECSGFVNVQPVVRIEWEGKADLAKVFFYSDHDPTLIIQSPDGAFHCNDDASDLLLDPSITFEDPQDGAYNIWVGSYYADQLIPGVLVVTTREDVDVDTFTLDGLIKRGPVMDVTENTNAKPVEALVNVIQRYKQAVEQIQAGGEALSVDVTVEGNVPAFDYAVPGQICNGFIGQTPDLVFDWSGEADALSVYFEGDGDSTLMVVGPGERVLCNDDAAEDNANPLVIVSDPVEGRYAVFVGRVHPEETVTGVLTVTDAANAQPKVLPPSVPTPSPESDKQ